LTKAAIVTATLDAERGDAVCKQAAECAGLTVPYYVSVDVSGRGGVYTANKGWKYVEKAYNPQFLCYLNDDVEITQPNWLVRLIRVLEARPEFGVAAPGGACATNPQRKAVPGMKKGAYVVNSLAFFCVVIKRAVLNELGFFDPQFTHFACDSDYCKRAQAAGYKCLWVRDVWVKHEFMPVTQRSVKVQRWKNHDMKLYLSRWGKPRKG
jgi:GT2 family glycosyltransferase